MRRATQRQQQAMARRTRPAGRPALQRAADWERSSVGDRLADIGTGLLCAWHPQVRRSVHRLCLRNDVVFLAGAEVAEVTYRFPQGGGVVTVASRALSSWFGTLGGMFILVDYFLTASISGLSGILYLSVVAPALGPGTEILGLGVTVWVAALVLVALGLLNWFGIGASARVSLLAALVALLSDLAILVMVFSHLSLADVWELTATSFRDRDADATAHLDRIRWVISRLLRA
jgi:hypothetical protein